MAVLGRRHAPRRRAGAAPRGRPDRGRRGRRRVPARAARPARAADLPLDPNGRSDPRRRAPLAHGWLDALVARGAWSPSRAVLDVVDVPLGPRPAPVLVHGDLHVRHLLVDDAGPPTGVIDWGDTCRADPAVDLSLAYAAFEGRARAALLAAYGPVDAEREARARALAVGLSAALADWATATGERELAVEYLAGLQRAVS